MRKGRCSKQGDAGYRDIRATRSKRVQGDNGDRETRRKDYTRKGGYRKWGRYWGQVIQETGIYRKKTLLSL